MGVDSECAGEGKREDDDFGWFWPPMVAVSGGGGVGFEWWWWMGRAGGEFQRRWSWMGVGSCEEGEKGKGGEREREVIWQVFDVCNAG